MDSNETKPPLNSLNEPPEKRFLFFSRSIPKTLAIVVMGGLIIASYQLILNRTEKPKKDTINLQPVVQDSTKRLSTAADSPFTIESLEPTGELSIPRWVVMYPGASSPEIADNMSTDDTAETLAFRVSTEDTPDQVIAYYQEQLKQRSFVVEVTRTPVFSVVDATASTPWRRLRLLMAVGNNDITKIVFQCQEKQ